MAVVGGMPSGTVTFLFTDVEGSTVAWEEHTQEMRVALIRHDEIVRECVASHGGYVFATAGDSFAVSFARADEAVAAAVEAQRGLATEEWPSDVVLRVRMGLHTGEAFERDGDYFGPAVNRAARLMSAAHGGQVVASESTRDVVGDAVGFVDVGVHRLKDLSAPQRIYQVVAEGLGSSFPPLRTMDVVRHNLPVVADELLGRDEVVGEVNRLLGSRSLVTLVGVGGIGKTRLSLQVAADLVGEFDDGVWWCELAPVGEPKAVANAVAQAIGIRQHPGRSMVDSVAEFCRRRRMLVVLDNCEHVLDGAADLVGAVLRAAPGVTVLANSREAIGVAGEQTVPIGSLDFDDEASPGVALFVERASAVRPDVDWSVEDRGVARRICERLDGVPLAIELAASRARSMTLVDIQSHLEDAFRLLRGGRRGVERHRTLQAAIDWSYEPLEEPSRRLFERLAVFAGGWDLDAAEAVCADGEFVDALDVVVLLDELVAKSLVAVDTGGTHARYRLLEPLRQYAEDRLAQRGEADIYHDRHLDYFTAWVEDWYERMYAEELAWSAAIRTEWANLRAAVAWGVAAREIDRPARLVFATGPALSYHLEHEVAAWAQQVLDLDGIDDHPLGPRVAAVVGNSRWWLGDIDGAERNSVRAEQMAAYRPDGAEEVMSRSVRLRTSGDYLGHLRMLSTGRPVDQREREWFLHFVGHAHGSLSPYQDLSVTEACLSELRADAEATGSDRLWSRVAHLEAMTFMARGDPARAASRYRDAIAHARRVGYVFAAHVVALELGAAAALAGDTRKEDLDYFAQTVREKVEAGQRPDLWTTLTACVFALLQHGYGDLAADIYRGLETSPWSTLPFMDELGKIIPAKETTEPVDLDDLVNRTLLALDQLRQ